MYDHSQTPFQPSSTTYDEKRRRYLVWNNIGSITCMEDHSNNRIEIRFTNVNGKNRNEAFPDNFNFTMAALSYEGAVFASDPEESEEGGGYCRLVAVVNLLSFVRNIDMSVLLSKSRPIPIPIPLLI